MSTLTYADLREGMAVLCKASRRTMPLDAWQQRAAAWKQFWREELLEGRPGMLDALPPTESEQS